MSAPLMIQIDRLGELGSILGQMIEADKVGDNKRFWELDRQFQEAREVHKLEDEINVRAS